ncbi:MAG: C4-type zinc ribbon domain-containing protein [Spirosomaceae bacterium]|nr:C4-type zinc ribbon domain-containing protein [Spirosomataceae bacterium]
MELSIADKLDALLALQELDSSLDSLYKLRGDLPEEVADLENELAGVEKRLSRFKEEVGTIEQEITDYKLAKKECEKLIIKYKEQQNNVRNSREYDALDKELELQELDIQLADKKSREAEFKIKTKQSEIDDALVTVNQVKAALEAKNNELNKLIGESEDEEKKLRKKRDKAAKAVEERLLKAYERIRSSVRNGLAVVEVDRGACGGCFNVVPPQRQADIMEKLKIIVCEHCGRILADADQISVYKRRK